jgi:hypothetical protein
MTTAKGRHITVVLNGQKTLDLRNDLFKEGPFTLQHGDGVIKGADAIAPCRA